MEITINNKTVKLKKTFRSVIAYEQATGKMFNPVTLTDIIMYMYCVLISSDTTLEVTFDDFMDWLDSQDNAIQDFNDWLAKVNSKDSTLAKKKKTAKK